MAATACYAGATSAVDSLKIDDSDEEVETFAPGDGASFYTLEFSTNFLMCAPGRLRFYATPDSAPVNVISNLITPTSMARDGATGDLFITNIFPGTITRVTGIASLVKDVKSDPLGEFIQGSAIDPIAETGRICSYRRL